MVINHLPTGMILQVFEAPFTNLQQRICYILQGGPQQTSYKWSEISPLSRIITPVLIYFRPFLGIITPLMTIGFRGPPCRGVYIDAHRDRIVNHHSVAMRSSPYGRG